MKTAIQKALKEMADPDKGKEISSYMKNILPFRGLQQPYIAHIFKQFKKEVNELDDEQKFKLADQLMRQEFGEDKKIGLMVAEKIKFDLQRIKLTEPWFTEGHIQEWATADTYCGRVLKYFLQNKENAQWTQFLKKKLFQEILFQAPQFVTKIIFIILLNSCACFNGLNMKTYGKEDQVVLDSLLWPIKRNVIWIFFLISVKRIQFIKRDLTSWEQDGYQDKCLQESQTEYQHLLKIILSILVVKGQDMLTKRRSLKINSFLSQFSKKIKLRIRNQKNKKYQLKPKMIQ